ncbi:MAG: hypothetical protein EPN36_12135 [Rhodanobacteraceae bacterium]|nr:MAG: hypothetical protein EPN36_12135 [Rhodanobacteraceae bacterium]
MISIRRAFRLTATFAVAGFVSIAASAATPTTTGALDSFEAPVRLFLQTAGTAAKSVADHLTTQQGLLILSACVAIRILAIVIPMMADKNGGDLGPETVKLGVTIAVVLTLLSQWTSGFDIYDKVWSGLDGLLNTVVSAASAAGATSAPAIAGQGDPLPSLAKWLFDAAVNGILSVYNDIGALTGVLSSHGVMHTVLHPFEAVAGVGTFLICAVLAIIGVLVVAAVYLVMFFEMFLSWAHIIVSLAFGPLVLSFYPVKPNWGKNIVQEVAVGIMTFLATVFLVAIANTFIVKATQVLDASAAAANANSTSIGAAAIATIAVYVFVVFLIGFGVAAVAKVAAALVSGNDHFGGHRGVGGAIAGAVLGAIAGAASKNKKPSGGGKKSGGKQPAPAVRPRAPSAATAAR